MAPFPAALPPGLRGCFRVDVDVIEANKVREFTQTQSLRGFPRARLDHQHKARWAAGLLVLRTRRGVGPQFLVGRGVYWFLCVRILGTVLETDPRVSRLVKQVDTDYLP